MAKQSCGILVCVRLWYACGCAAEMVWTVYLATRSVCLPAAADSQDIVLRLLLSSWCCNRAGSIHLLFTTDVRFESAMRVWTLCGSAASAYTRPADTITPRSTMFNVHSENGRKNSHHHRHSATSSTLRCHTQRQFTLMRWRWFIYGLVTIYVMCNCDKIIIVGHLLKHTAHLVVNNASHVYCGQVYAPCD